MAAKISKINIQMYDLIILSLAIINNINTEY